MRAEIDIQFQKFHIYTWFRTDEAKEENCCCEKRVEVGEGEITNKTKIKKKTKQWTGYGNTLSSLKWKHKLGKEV